MAGGFIPADRPPDSVDIEEFARAEYALERARNHGDIGPLVQRLRSTAFLLPEERALLADILDKKWKRPAHRQAEDPRVALNKKLLLAQCYWEQREVCALAHERAVYQVAKDKKEKVDNVRKAIRDNESFLGTLLPKTRNTRKAPRSGK
jgi:hypothetical protein